jgi:hypothetical protein
LVSPKELGGAFTQVMNPSTYLSIVSTCQPVCLQHIGLT